jgi:hypothetical protein
LVASALIIAAAEANFFIPLGNDTSMGIGELFTTLSSALGGPITSVVTIFVVYGVVSLIHPEYFPDMISTYILVADGIAHLSAMLLVAIGYRKWLYPQARKTGIFLAGWFLMIGAYYYLVLFPLTVVLINFVAPGFDRTYLEYAKNFIPEALGTAVLTTLVWFALPARYRRPQWLEPKNVPGQSDEIQTK